MSCPPLLLPLYPIGNWRSSLIGLRSKRVEKQPATPDKSEPSGVCFFSPAWTCCSCCRCFNFVFLFEPTTMASLYQRFSGKINTNNSFPHPPPEASRLLGVQAADEENGGKPREPRHAEARAHLPFRKKRSEDEAVRPSSFIKTHSCFFFFQTYFKLISKWKVIQSEAYIPQTK